MNAAVLLRLSLAIVLTGCASGGDPVADTRVEIDLVVSGGTVLTMAGPNLEAGAVAIDEGAILAVGPASEIDHRFRARDRIDAGGGAILPGFVNAHTHVPMTLFRGIADDLALMDWLQDYIFPAEAKNVDRDFVRWGTRLAAAEMIRTGTTTFADMYYFEADIARETKAAGLRGVLGETLIDFPAPDNETWDAAIAYMREFAREFEGDPLITAAVAPHSPYTVSREHLMEVRRLADELGIPILIHLAETKDEVAQVLEQQGMTPTLYLDSIGFLRSDVTAAHTIHLTAEEIAILARRGVGSAHNPESNMMLASGIAPVVALLAAGVDVGIGTDGPAGSNNDLDMIAETASAARLQKIAGGDPRALTARGVLEMATIGGAKALGLADRIGTIEPGKRADLVVIDLSEPGTQPVYSIESAIVYATNGEHVTHTIVDGRVLMRDGILLTVDEDDAVRMAREYRDRILRSLEPGS